MTEEHQEGHSHRLPASLLALLAVITIGLLAGIVLSYLDARSTERRLAALEDYVQGRGEYRDREAARMKAEWQERNRRLACDLADQFPEGGWLDRLRAEYGCGPGIPISQLTPDEQALIADRPSASAGLPPPPPLSSPPPKLGDGATVNRSPEPPPAPQPAPTPQPSGVLEPITDPLCNDFGICLEVP